MAAINRAVRSLLDKVNRVYLYGDHSAEELDALSVRVVDEMMKHGASCSVISSSARALNEGRYNAWYDDCFCHNFFGVLESAGVKFYHPERARDLVFGSDFYLNGFITIRAFCDFEY